MVATIYEVQLGDPFGAVHRTFERPEAIRAEPRAVAVKLPDAAQLVQRSLHGVVVGCELNGQPVQLEAGEVLTLARLGLCGFKLAEG